MTQRITDIQTALETIRTAADQHGKPMQFMEVCGTHTMSAFRCGLHSLMPDRVKLLSGPGCPVCVTAQGDIDMLIDLAANHRVTVCTYGDMIRVPGNQASLESARSDGADVRVVYSAMDAVKLAAAEPKLQVVFAAVGFETTAPASAAAVREAAKRGLDNFSVLTSHKLIIPAMRALLEGGQVRLDGFMLPGHVSVIIGSQPYERIAEQHKLPCVVAGFEAVQMAAAMAQLATMARDQAHGVVNAYAQAVQAEGNPIAQQILEEVFEPADTPWRALGVIPQSGLVLRPAFEKFDAQRRFNLTRPADRNPPGCLCGKVITGMASPHDCELFATQCTPIHPIGPCMVSSEGTCQAWFKYHRNRPAPPSAKPQPSSTPA